MKRFPAYFLSLLFIFIIPSIIFSFVLVENGRLNIFFVFSLVLMVIGSLWDVWATKHGWRDRFWLWTFNDKYMLGPKVFGIPIEEYLFFFFGALFITTAWEVLNIWITHPSSKNLTVLLVLLFWSIAGVLLPKLKQPN